MAETAKPYEEGVQYRARVARVVMVGAFKYLPRDETIFDGAILNGIVADNGEDALAYAKPI